jgi:hypothetical protein
LQCWTEKNHVAPRTPVRLGRIGRFRRNLLSLGWWDRAALAFGWLDAIEPSWLEMICDAAGRAVLPPSTKHHAIGTARRRTQYIKRHKALRRVICDRMNI